MTEILSRDSRFVVLMKIILNFVIALEKEYNEKFALTRIADIVKDRMINDFRIETNAQPYYRYIRVDNMMLKPESVIAVVENVKGDATGSDSLGISHLNAIWLRTATVEEQSIVTEAARNVVRNLNKPAPWHVSRFYISARRFWWIRGLCFSITVQALL